MLLNFEVPLLYQFAYSFKKTWASFKEDEINNNDRRKRSKTSSVRGGDRREETIKEREL
jgi:hypothetical protein